MRCLLRVSVKCIQTNCSRRSTCREVTSRLEGEFRPGHFKGVATVVAKLLNIVGADRAYFGEKDAQQLAVIRKMVADLNMPVEIVAVPTVRESDGLAMSSRNRLLPPVDRAIAPVLYQALSLAKEKLQAGAIPADARTAALELLSKTPQIQVQYLEVADAANHDAGRPRDGPPFGSRRRCGWVKCAH
ncbi:MAG: pantoate--beta-alanine ligase [Acidobacteriota bacterium]